MSLLLSKSESDKLTTLHNLEDEVKAGLEEGRKLADKISLALYQILTEKLYLAELDDRGLPLYSTQEQYIPYLLQKLGISRATLYNYYTPAKIAMATGLNAEEYVATGGKQMWARVKSEVPYDDTTGEVMVDKGELISTLVEIASPGPDELQLSPVDIRKRLASLSGDPETKMPDVSYYKAGRGLHYKLYSNTGLQEGIVCDWALLPEPVQNDLIKRLYLKGEPNVS